jgi:hypothetical protein
MLPERTPSPYQIFLRNELCVNFKADLARTSHQLEYAPSPAKAMRGSPHLNARSSQYPLRNEGTAIFIQIVCTWKAVRLAAGQSGAREFPLSPALGVELRVLRVHYPGPVCGVSKDKEQYVHRREIEPYFNTWITNRRLFHWYEPQDM